MASHMPPIPPANRNKNDRRPKPAKTRGQSMKHCEPQNIAEEGDTANIKQNTTNEGFFRGRRIT
jgi:hypothetical protein